jgi:pyruvate dehydrogenase E2 component (dihydrolipoamide acetyltransferase)
MAPKTTEVYIPKYGQTVEEVKIVQWLAEDGAEIKKGQEIMEIETDKTTFFVEAEGAGFLHRGPYEVGQTVPVLEIVALIGPKDIQFKAGTVGDEATETTEVAESIELTQTEETLPVSESSVSSATSKVFASPRARKLAGERHVDLAQVTPTGGEGVRVTEKDVLAYLATAPKATPLAEKLAAETGVDLRKLTGTGPGGKITREDVEAARAATAGRGEAPSPTPAAPAPATPPAPAAPAPVPAPLPVADVTERIPLKGVRAIIVDRMGTSVHTTARVTLVTEVDATEFVTMRERLKAKVSEAWGFAPGYNDLLALIVAKALRKFPHMNARLAADAIELMGHVNLGMAVDTERGLLVPVIRDADTKTLQQFGAEFRELVDRARKGRSMPDDITGGTFTITNLGMHEIDAFTPVINLPEAAILGVGRIAPKWVYRPESPNAPVLRQMLTLSLVFDHRIIDGAPAARFLQFIKGLIEEPYLLMA